MSSDPTPNGLDPPIIELVRVLNELPGLETVGSCAGHEKPAPGAWPSDQWYVTFVLQPANADALVAFPTPEAWISLEWLAWLVNNNLRRAGRQVAIIPTAPPPYLNEPGRMLKFALEGERGEHGIEPSGLADEIESLAPDLYISAEDVAETNA